MRALIVVDMQVDSCPCGAMAVARGDEIVAAIDAPMAASRPVVAPCSRPE